VPKRGSNPHLRLIPERPYSAERQRPNQRWVMLYPIGRGQKDDFDHIRQECSEF
jgi:hypothetical protein